MVKRFDSFLVDYFAEQLRLELVLIDDVEEAVEVHIELGRNFKTVTELESIVSVKYYTD